MLPSIQRELKETIEELHEAFSYFCERLNKVEKTAAEISGDKKNKMFIKLTILKERVGFLEFLDKEDAIFNLNRISSILQDYHDPTISHIIFNENGGETRVRVVKFPFKQLERILKKNKMMLPT